MTEEWWAEQDEVFLFAQVLCSADWLEKPQDVVDFIRSPWKWTNEHREWEASDRPLTTDVPAWEMFMRRLEKLV